MGLSVADGYIACGSETNEVRRMLLMGDLSMLSNKYGIIIQFDF